MMLAVIIALSVHPALTVNVARLEEENVYLKESQEALATLVAQASTRFEREMAVIGGDGGGDGDGDGDGDEARRETTTDKPLLIIGIPTVPRRNVDYLTPTLKELNKQLNHGLLKDLAVVWLMKSNPFEPHPALDEAKAAYDGEKWIKFFDNPIPYKDPSHDAGTPNVPGWKVRTQTKNIISLSRAALYQSKYFLFMEDDFEVCGRGMDIFAQAIAKADAYYPNWLSIRASYGMNGFILNNDLDLQTFVDYMDEHHARRPPDHLAVEWSAGETDQSAGYKKNRPHMTYRFNLFEHLGRQSSLRPSEAEIKKTCFAQLIPDMLFEVEAFNLGTCQHDDISPCHPKESNITLPTLVQDRDFL